MLILRDAVPQHLDQVNESVNERVAVEVVVGVVDAEVLPVEEVVALLLLGVEVRVLL